MKSLLQIHTLTPTMASPSTSLISSSMNTQDQSFDTEASDERYYSCSPVASVVVDLEPADNDHSSHLLIRLRESTTRCQSKHVDNNALAGQCVTVDLDNPIDVCALPESSRIRGTGNGCVGDRLDSLVSDLWGDVATIKRHPHPCYCIILDTCFSAFTQYEGMPELVIGNSGIKIICHVIPKNACQRQSLSYDGMHCGRDK